MSSDGRTWTEAIDIVEVIGNTPMVELLGPRRRTRSPSGSCARSALSASTTSSSGDAVTSNAFFGSTSTTTWRSGRTGDSAWRPLEASKGSVLQPEERWSGDEMCPVSHSGVRVGGMDAARVCEPFTRLQHRSRRISIRPSRTTTSPRPATQRSAYTIDFIRASVKLCKSPRGDGSSSCSTRLLTLRRSARPTPRS